eukprot:gene6662-10827_t
MLTKIVKGNKLEIPKEASYEFELMKDKLKQLKVKLYFPNNINLKILFNRYDKRDGCLEKFEVKKILRDFLLIIKEYLQEEEKVLKDQIQEELKKYNKLKDSESQKKSKEQQDKCHKQMVQLNVKKKAVNELDGYIDTFVVIIFGHTSKLAFDRFREIVEDIVGLKPAKKILNFEN